MKPKTQTLPESKGAAKRPLHRLVSQRRCEVYVDLLCAEREIEKAKEFYWDDEDLKMREMVDVAMQSLTRAKDKLANEKVRGGA